MDFSNFITIPFVILIILVPQTLSIRNDKDALISFKSQITIYPLDSPLSTWDENLSPCNWTGVVCNKQTQRVVRLYLPNLRMVGPISPFIANLSFLTTLELQNNQLRGQLPDELCNLSQLRFLNLSYNSLNGVVPTNISQCKRLQVLDLMQNQISGQIPRRISYLKQLRVLNLASNQLSGSIPRSLTNILSLNHLNLGTNKLGNSIPSDLSRLRNLKFLDLTINNFTGIVPPSIYNMSSLAYLALASNNLSGNLPENIGFTLPNLTKFNLGGNKIYGTIPPSIGELRGLQLLNLSYALVSGRIPKEIGRLERLQILGLADNKLSGEIPDSLGNLKGLSRIDLSRNHLEGSIPTSFENFKNLISMDLSDNRLTGNIPREILSLPKLSAFLNLSQNFLTGPLPDEIELLENVVTINVADNKLTGNIPQSIGNCKSLKQLFLARNMFVGQIPASLGQVRGLKVLDLSSNGLSGSIPLDLQNLRLLQLLNLSFNNLGGEIPLCGISVTDFAGNRELRSGFVCEHIRARRRTTVFIIIIRIAIAALCFAVGLVIYLRKGKGKTTGMLESFKGQHQMISYHELRQATVDFKEENQIGQGSFGSVYRGLVQGMEVAVKVLDMRMAKSRKSFLAECEALRRIRHRNLVKLITVCSSIDYKNDEFLALVFEFMSNGNLDDWLRGKRWYANWTPLNAMDRLNLAIGVASAMDYLHNETEIPIVHCDLKPSNILLDSDMTPKVGDFGLAKLLIDNQTCISSTHTLKGTIGYIPPEYGFGEKPSIAGDVYSYGILLLELFTGKGPTDDSFTGGMCLKKWVERSFPTYLDQVVDPELLEETKIFEGQCGKPDDCLITIFGIGLACTVDSPEHRISMRDALRKLVHVKSILQIKS